MKEIDLKKLKKIQLEMLDYIDKFCEENEIRYWIDSGTLLGAVRHKGYIPWDDDIDLGMLRKDYDKFVNLFNKKCDPSYRFDCYECNKNYTKPYGKVLDLRTVMYEPDKKTGVKSSVFVDVFPYDNIADDEKARNKQFRIRDRCKKLNNLQQFDGFYIKKKNKYNFIRHPLHVILQILPKGFFIEKSILNCKKFEKQKTKNVGNLAGNTKQYCNKGVFDDFVLLWFEGKKYPAPIGYDEWLRSFYGDYMKLPPKEKQVSHHRFEAYEVKEGD